MKPRISPYLWSSLALALAFLANVCLGDVAIPPLDIARMILARLPFLEVAADWPRTSEIILFDIRLPAIALLALTGAALGGSGAAYQGILRNPLADPYLIGVAPGAGLGAVVAMVWPLPTGLLGLSAIPAGAFVGAMATIAVVYGLARVGKTAPVTTLILAGVAVGSFASALTSLLMLATQRDLRRPLYFLLGGFGEGGWAPVVTVLPWVAAGTIVLIVFAHPINVLQFGDDQARQLGMHVERVKLILILAASLTAAAAVAFSGIIGFVGLVVPHLMRLLAGPDYRRLVPLSVIGGAAALLAADAVARAAGLLSAAPVAAAVRQLPVGVVTAFLGAPFFLFLLRRVRQSYW